VFVSGEMSVRCTCFCVPTDLLLHPGPAQFKRPSMAAHGSDFTNEIITSNACLERKNETVEEIRAPFDLCHSEAVPAKVASAEERTCRLSFEGAVCFGVINNNQQVREVRASLSFPFVLATIKGFGKRIPAAGLNALSIITIHRCPEPLNTTWDYLL